MERILDVTGQERELADQIPRGADYADGVCAVIPPTVRDDVLHFRAYDDAVAIRTVDSKEPYRPIEVKILHDTCAADEPIVT